MVVHHDAVTFDRATADTLQRGIMVIASGVFTHSRSWMSLRECAPSAMNSPARQTPCSLRHRSAAKPTAPHTFRQFWYACAECKPLLNAADWDALARRAGLPFRCRPPS
ncbi:hypothetical protein GCM10010411_73460 [Actinomadura fulvescens]|uniref:Uncharacterized protein n=1 Tax=Actinomadura fulvescens TaxID=46160 RepID=A0ABP6CU34_9ACTN